MSIRWAAPPAASQSFSFTPNDSSISIRTLSSTTTFKPPPQRRSLRSLVVRQRQRQPDDNDNHHHHQHHHHEEEDVVEETRQKNVGIMGQAVLTAIKSTASSPKKQQITKEQKSEQAEAGRERQQLSGSDVLWALNRASIEKAKQSKIKKKKKKKKNRDPNRQEEKKAMDVNDHHSVRPLCIKSEWETRLVELEKRLEEELMLLDL